MIALHTKKSGALLVALSFLLTLHTSVAVEDRLCHVGLDGQEECEAVYNEHDTYEYDDPPLDDDDDDDDDDDVKGEQFECTDLHDTCETLADDGECDTNPGFMKYECAVSCGTCSEFDAAYEALWDDGTGDGPCTDRNEECMGWAAMGECGFNPGFMLVECERSCLICFEDT